MWNSKLRWPLLAALVLIASSTAPLLAQNDGLPKFAQCPAEAKQPAYVASNCTSREHRLYVPVFATVGDKDVDTPLEKLPEQCWRPGTTCVADTLPAATEWGIGHFNKVAPQLFTQKFPVPFKSENQPPLNQWIKGEIEGLALRFQAFELAWRLGADAKKEEKPVLLRLPVAIAEKKDWQPLGTCRRLRIGRVRIDGQKDVYLTSSCQGEAGKESFIWQLEGLPSVPQEEHVAVAEVALFPSRVAVFPKTERFTARERLMPDEQGEKAHYLIALDATFTGTALAPPPPPPTPEWNWALKAAIGLAVLLVFLLIVNQLARRPQPQTQGGPSVPKPLPDSGHQAAAPRGRRKWLRSLKSLRVLLKWDEREDPADRERRVPVDLGDNVANLGNVATVAADVAGAADGPEAERSPIRPLRQGRDNKKKEKDKDNGHEYTAPVVSMQPPTQDIIRGVIDDERFRGALTQEIQNLVATETRSHLKSVSVLQDIVEHSFIKSAVQSQAASFIKKEVKVEDLAARIAESASVQDKVTSICAQFEQSITKSMTQSFEKESRALLAKSQASWAADTAEVLLAHAMAAAWPGQQPPPHLPPPQTPLCAPREAAKAIKALQDLVQFFVQLYRAWCEQGGPLDQLNAASAVLAAHHETAKFVSEREKLRELHERAIRTLQSVILIDAPLINALAAAANGGAPPPSVFLDVARRRWPASLSTSQDTAKFINEWCRLRLPLLQLTIEAMPRELGALSSAAGGLKQALERINRSYPEARDFVGNLNLIVEGTAVMFHTLVTELYQSINVRYFPIRLYQDDLDSRHVVLAMKHTDTISDVKYGRLLVALGLVQRHGTVVSVRQPLIQLQDPGATSDRWEGLLEYAPVMQQTP